MPARAQKGQVPGVRNVFSEKIVYESTGKPSVHELLEFYTRLRTSSSAEGEGVQKMIDNTFCFVTARHEGELVGFARGMVAGTWGRLAECKLDPAYQGPACLTRTDGRVEHDALGIAREMARRVVETLHSHGAERIEALAHGTEVDFCEELGFRRMRGLVALELPVGITIMKETTAPAMATAQMAV